jgi:N-acetylglucosaminyl-diphospho-decaprenol L-rhamnosyltransferase
MTAELSLCIVNHRTPDLLRQCLDSVTRTASDCALEVFVVNNTLDDAAEVREIVERLPGGRFIQNPAPLGFAANQNQMLRQAGGCYLVSLNSDTVLQPGALQELRAFMQAHPRAGIAGPKLLRPGGGLQPSGRNFPTALTHYLEASGLWRLLRGQRWVGRWYTLCHPHDRAMRVDWLTGACLMVRAEAARRAGFYDAELFPGLYGEDLEWCWRMRQAGWQVWFDPNAVVQHLENQSPMDSRTLQMYHGFYAFCGRYYSAVQCRRIRAATFAALLPRWLLAGGPRSRATYSQLIMLPMPKDSKSA